MPEILQFQPFPWKTEFGIETGQLVFDPVATAAATMASWRAQTQYYEPWVPSGVGRRNYTRAEVEKLRLAGYAEQASHYGRGIPKLWGKARLAGNILWCSNAFYLSDDLTGQPLPGQDPYPLPGVEFDPDTTHWTTDVAILVCAGPIDRVRVIWADDTVIYADEDLISSGAATLGTGFSYVRLAIHRGGPSQGVDSTLEAHLGEGNVPAYRGRCYVVIEGLDLSRWGNRLPTFSFHVRERSGGSAPIAAVLEDLAEEVGLEAADYDFSGATGFT
jgi:hypothetical protein